MIIGIPLRCPKCGGKLKAVSYDETWKILKPRSWHICSDCGFEREASDFKKNLLTV